MLRIIQYFFGFIILNFLVSCDLSSPSLKTDTSTVSSANANIKSDQKGRLAWQKPSVVIDKLGDLTGKSVADIGAGTGYFTFRFARDADQVIAVDIDPEMIEMIEVFRENLDSVTQGRIETRLATEMDSKLWPEEVDIAVIINTIGYIDDRPQYLKELRRKIKSGGTLMIVDFKLKRLPEDIAPPPESRVNIIELEEVLMASGYDIIDTDDISLDYQYIIMAEKG